MEQSALSDPDKVLSPKRTAEVTGLSRTTIWRLRKDNDFVEAVPLSPGRIGYRAGALAHWLATRGGAPLHA